MKFLINGKNQANVAMLITGLFSIGVVMSTLTGLKRRDSIDYDIGNVDITSYNVTTNIVNGKEPNLLY